MGKKIFIGIAIALLVLFFKNNVFATTYYVAQNGPNANDSNSGSETSPWRTLKHATQVVVAGDTVIVKEGVYIDTTASLNNMRVFDLVNSGTEGNPITFRSEPPLAATLRRNATYLGAFGTMEKSYIIVDGFKVEGAIGFRLGSHNEIRNCEVTLGSIMWNDVSLHWGIWLQNSDHALVENNYVHDMTKNLGNSSHNSACIMTYGDSSDSILQYNTVDGNYNYLYGFGTKAGYEDRVKWRYNLAKNCSVAFLAMGRDGTGTSYDCEVYQNVSINSTIGVEFERDTDGWLIYNNTIYGAEKFLNVVFDDDIDINVWNNIAVSSDTGLVYYAGYETGFPFSTVFEYCDYNNYTGTYSRFAYRETRPTILYTTLSDWQNNEYFDANSSTNDAQFVNAGGTDPADYKRLSYSKDGRGGPYAYVRGAYITGEEVIGYTPDYDADDSNASAIQAPRSPSNLMIVAD